ncbi:hypothetical protein QR680_004656 [Steinernema hermaphroditum]|uniref:Uncharacterized protein n=1 Tax=Steinernema hermaphroditum TaxID=289476 RepID=A0AA39LU11_9BILA|nr:hypothetical protein QR680_004656 [Steinernema hermaphroditum]
MHINTSPQLQYADQNDKEQFYVAQHFPEQLKKKVTLLKYFRSYMQENLLKAGQQASKAGAELERLPVVRDWKRTRSAIGLHLTNGTLQVNFFESVLICGLLELQTLAFTFFPRIGLTGEPALYVNILQNSISIVNATAHSLVFLFYSSNMADAEWQRAIARLKKIWKELDTHYRITKRNPAMWGNLMFFMSTVQTVSKEYVELMTIHDLTVGNNMYIKTVNEEKSVATKKQMEN